MKCDNCKVEKCDARNVIKKFGAKEPELIAIIERNCTTSYEPIVITRKQLNTFKKVSEIITKIIKDERERVK